MEKKPLIQVMKKSGLDIAHAQMEIQKTVIQIHLLDHLSRQKPEEHEVDARTMSVLHRVNGTAVQ